MSTSGTFEGIPDSPFDEMNDIADILYSGDAFKTDSNGVIKLDSFINNVVIGDRVILGSYNTGHNGAKENLEWDVLDVINGSALLITRYAIECMRYHDKDEMVFWDRCSLNKWLNNSNTGGFLNILFSDAQRNIIEKRNAASQVFILSEDDAKRYYDTSEKRSCEPTVYLLERGVGICSNRCIWWWLQSRGYTPSISSFVDGNGNIFPKEAYSGIGVCCVRPAMWIDISIIDRLKQF